MKGEVSVQGCKGIPPSRMRRQHAQISKARASHLSCAKLDVWDACRTPVSRCSSMLDPPSSHSRAFPPKPHPIRTCQPCTLSHIQSLVGCGT